VRAARYRVHRSTASMPPICFVALSLFTSGPGSGPMAFSRRIHDSPITLSGLLAGL
jgi:hypothetical protein